jgi:RNA-directed DNA polymerase
MPAPTPTVGGGTAESRGSERQSEPARGGLRGEEAPGLMEQVVRRPNMVAALVRVVQNGGAAGCDGMTVDELVEHCREHWPEIRRELLRGTYAPQPVRRVEIPKPSGKGVRVLGIPTALDRMIQQALLQVLTPIFDPTFSEDSYGFRPGKSAHDAVRRATEHMTAGHRWVVDLDLEKFFDRVNHDVLMARVSRRVGDKRVLRLIGRFLRAGLMEGGVASPRTEGTPQGGPLSPLLSNTLLDELDKELEQRGHRFVRYADDFNVYVKSAAAGERVMASLERFLAGRLRLRVNREKSAVGRPWSRKFLGYSVTTHRVPKLKPAKESVKRLREKLKGVFRRGRGRRLDRLVMELLPIIRGWVGYFRLAETTGVFEELDQWIRRRLRCVIWRQWKRPRTRHQKLRAWGLDEERARASAWNGRGPWWNAGAPHMNHAFPLAFFQRIGLQSLLVEHRRLNGLI